MDLVYTYVNDSNEWRSKYNLHNKQMDDHRFDSKGEIFLSLKTVEKYANFVRRIFLVNDGQPFDLDFLSKEFRKKITFVDHTEIIPAEFLPTFNSCVIEMFLWRIPEISQSFVYLNDDVFFGNYATEDFFSGKIFGTCHTYDPLNKQQHEVMYRRTHEVFQSRFNTNFWIRNNHTVFYMRTETCEKVFQEFNDVLTKTAIQKVRVYDQQSYSFLTLSNLMLYKDGLCDISDKGEFFERLNKTSMLSLMRSRPVVFCINSLPDDSIWEKFQTKILKDTLCL